MRKPELLLKRSKEWADKISKSKTGKTVPAMSIAKKGHKHSEETKRKIGLKSSNRSEESRLRMSLAQRSKVMPKQKPESIEKMRKSKLGVKQPNISRALIGRPGIKGEKSNLWKGGVTSINALIRSSGQYRLWRKSVFERDNWTCIWCGARSSKGNTIILHADHIKPFAYYPELRFAIDNGRTLCINCHKTTDSYMGKARQKYGK